MEGVQTPKNPYMKVAWVDSIWAFGFVVIGALGGGWLFYGLAAFWAVNAYKHQRMAWEEEERERANAGKGPGEGGEDSSGEADGGPTAS